MKNITFPYNFQNIKSIFHFPGTLDPPPNHHSRSSSSPIAADSANESKESAGNNADAEGNRTGLEQQGGKCADGGLVTAAKMTAVREWGFGNE